MKFTVNKILYTTMEKDGSTLIGFNEVAKPTLEVYKMLISEVLNGKRFMLTNDNTCYVEGREKTDGVFVADLHQYWFTTFVLYPCRFTRLNGTVTM